MKKSVPDSPAVKATVLLASTTTVMAAVRIAPALPGMEDHFSDVPNVDLLVRLVLTFPALFIVIGATMAGYVVDRWGRKNVLLFSTALFGLSGSSAFLLDSLPAILVSRAVLGFAIAGVGTSVTTIIADYYVGRTRARLMGWQMTSLALTGVLVISLVGIMANVSWRASFLIYLTAFISIPFVAIWIREPTRPKTGVAPQRSSGEGGKLPTGIRLPSRRIALIYGVAMLWQLMLAVIHVQLPFYLEELTEASATDTGVAIAVFALFAALTSFVYGPVSSRIKITGIVHTSIILFGLGFGIIGFADNYGHVLLGLAMVGLGLGLHNPNVNFWLTSEVPVEMRGRALGGLMTFAFLGQFMAPLVSQPVSNQFGFAETFSLAGGVLLLIAGGFIVTTLLGIFRPPDHTKQLEHGA